MPLVISLHCNEGPGKAQPELSLYVPLQSTNPASSVSQAFGQIQPSSSWTDIVPGQLVYLLFHYLGFCVSLSKIFFPSKAIKNHHLKVFNVCIPMHLKSMSQLEERVNPYLPGAQHEKICRAISVNPGCLERL